MVYIPPTSKGWTSQSFGTHPGGYNPAGGHTGEDIAVPVGTPLVAMAEGVVAHVGYFSGAYSDNPWWIHPGFAGYVVTVDYGPYISHYAHCSGSPVLSGKRVKKGDVVAYSGNTGTATSGPHLHWEVMPDGWDFNNGTYGRINPRAITSAALAPQGTITPQEDDFMALFANLAEFKQAVADVQQPMEDVTRQFLGDKVDAAALRVLNGQQAMEDVTRDFLKDRIKEASPAEIALQVNAAGIAKEVQAELIKLIGGAK